MRTFADKPMDTDQVRPASPGRAQFGPGREAGATLHLQRTLGNRAVQRLFQAGAAAPHVAHDVNQGPVHPAPSPGLQAKRTVGPAGDIYEQEADHVAEQIALLTEPQPAPEGERLQASPAGPAGAGRIAVPPIVDEALALPGQPLDPGTRRLMEPRFGHGFGSVRVHTGPLAERSAESVAARAYTVGSHIVFGAGRYAPASRDGQRLLAHELTHVVQQGGGEGPRSMHKGRAAAPNGVEPRAGPRVQARSPVTLAAQPDPTILGGWPSKPGPAQIEPEPFGTDRRLGIRVVDPAEIERTVRWIMLQPGGAPAAQCKADFRKSPRIARANLEASHWRTDKERLLYARCYFEQFLSVGGERVDSEVLVRALVDYEVRRRPGDIVIHNPPTKEDMARLAELRKQRQAEAEKRFAFEGPLAEARAEFMANQSSSFWHASQLLAPHELTKAADAVIMATRDVANTIPLEFFEYYSDHLLMRMDDDEEEESQNSDTYALTDPDGDTRLRSDVIAFPESKLGPILLHELGHSKDVQNAMGLGSFQEGHGYAIEYFFSRDKVRKDKILDILSGDSLVVGSQTPALRKLFHVTLATLIALTEVIQRGSSPHLPASLVPDVETARRLIAERVVRSEPSSDQLKAISQHVTRNLDAFNLPGI
ncbi:MAG TPA: DUF4157 domain-containing protein [Anaerolineae bacterium]|nr:DUF4157 domain-containing protein [Anaerolineae bacterium]